MHASKAVIRVPIATVVNLLPCCRAIICISLFVYVYAMFPQVCLTVREPDKGLCYDVLLRVQQKRKLYESRVLTALYIPGYVDSFGSLRHDSLDRLNSTNIIYELNLLLIKQH